MWPLPLMISQITRTDRHASVSLSLSVSSFVLSLCLSIPLSLVLSLFLSLSPSLSSSLRSVDSSNMATFVSVSKFISRLFCCDVMETGVVMRHVDLTSDQKYSHPVLPVTSKSAEVNCTDRCVTDQWMKINLQLFGDFWR